MSKRVPDPGTSMQRLSSILCSSFCLLAVLASSACTTLTSDITTETRDNPEVNYDTYNTYAWAGSAQIVFDPVGQWEQPTLDTDEEVKFVINRELRKHGINQVNTNPDLLVAYAAGVDTTAMELKEDPKTQDKVLTNIPKASLVIALTDARTGYVVWLGYATANAQPQQTMENIRARIDFAVSEIFKSYNDSGLF
jgi:predicted DNA-binding transcriptional regulator